jgi:hypothetical protein
VLADTGLGAQDCRVVEIPHMPLANGVKDYLVECLREAPLAWRKGAVAMTILINAALIGLVYLGWHLDAYPTPYFLIGTSVIAVLDVLVILPFKLWRANKAEIERLKGNYSGARKALWQLRQEGVGLRNDGFSTRTLSSWTSKFEKWRAQVLEQAALLSMDLRHFLGPIDKISEQNNEPLLQFATKDVQLQKSVSVISEMLSRLSEYLNRTAEPR